MTRAYGSVRFPPRRRVLAGRAVAGGDSCSASTVSTASDENDAALVERYKRKMTVQ